MAVALARRAPELAIAAIATIIAWLFAWTILRHTRPMALPLDDGYRYLTYAKQLGSGHVPAGAGPSALWPLVLAVLWTLGARGDALVWAAFVVGAALYAATAIGCYRIARRFGGDVVGGAAALIVLAATPWCALAGLETALAGALLVATVLLLLGQPRTGRPRWMLVACLAALALARPELAVIVVVVVAVAVVARVRQRDLRAAAWWCLPLVALLGWLWLPSRALADGHLALPGFSWSYWASAVAVQTGRMLRGLFWARGSPLVLPPLVALAWLAGAWRTLAWARRESVLLAGVLIVVAPVALIELGFATSAAPWDDQHGRALMAAVPLLAVTAAHGLAYPARIPRRAWLAAIAVIGAGFVALAVPHLRADMLLFAQGARDTNTQGGALGARIAAELPDARVLAREGGAITYYAGTGDVIAFPADVDANGPGARFEYLEALPLERRPTHFAYDPKGLGARDWFGPTILDTQLRAAFIDDNLRLARAHELDLMAASWDHAGTAERPLAEHPGWAVVDRVDIADLTSERDHAWRGELGPRALGDDSAAWSILERETGPAGLVIDGGRTIRGGREAFTIGGDPAAKTRLIFRTGGARKLDANNPPSATPVGLAVLAGDSDAPVARAVIPVPDGAFIELPLDLPAGTPRELRIEATGPYRSYHWFVLQPQ